MNIVGGQLVLEDGDSNLDPAQDHFEEFLRGPVSVFQGIGERERGSTTDDERNDRRDNQSTMQ